MNLILSLLQMQNHRKLQILLLDFARNAPPPEMREVHFSYVAMRCLPFINVPLMAGGSRQHYVFFFQNTGVF